MKKLFFDIQITGHHSEYIGHLIDYLFINNDLDNEYFFVVHPLFSTQFPEIVSKTKDLKNISWIEVTKQEFDKTNSGSLIRNSFCLYNIMDFYAKKHKIDHVILLYFNTFQFPCIFYRSHYSISGILFLQFYRMDKNKLVDKLKYYRKYLITKFYTLNKKIVNIFILNDQKTVDYLNLEFKISQFKMLPDPIPVLKPVPDFDIYNHYKIDTNREIFLHIGSLDSRKGTFEILESLKYISKKKQNDVCLLLVGKSSSSLTEEKIHELISKAQKESDVQVIWDNQFVSNDLMKSLFDQCDGVLMPYKNTEASSGILGHAMASNKTIITTGSGLLKDMVEEYGSGLLLESVNPRAIAEAIDKIEFSKNAQIFLINNFVIEHSTENFARKVIGS